MAEARRQAARNRRMMQLERSDSSDGEPVVAKSHTAQLSQGNPLEQRNADLEFARLGL